MYKIKTSSLLFLESAAFVSILFDSSSFSGGSKDSASVEQDDNQREYVSPEDAGWSSEKLEE